LKKIDYTAAVIGGGPAGSAAARMMARAGANVLLVSAIPREAFQVGESLVPAAQNILEALDLGEGILSGEHLPSYGNASAWGSLQLVHTDFIRSAYGHGWHLNRPYFDTVLRQMAEEAGATVFNCAKLFRFQRNRSHWQLTLKTREGLTEVTCEWLFDCTGRSHRIVRSLGNKQHYEDKLLAFYTRFRPHKNAEEDLDSCTLVESVPQGWFHTALLPSGERVVTFFTDAGTPWVKNARSLKGFLKLIEGTVHISLKLEAHRYAVSANLRSTDARSSYLERYYGKGWLTAGDAATTFDPLSSQGIFSALYSGLKAGNALVEHLHGDREALPHYHFIVSEVYDRFLDNMRKCYSYEQRWLDSPFWHARTSVRDLNTS
jgi:flavin-dependent dehydrogenase